MCTILMLIKLILTGESHQSVTAVFAENDTTSIDQDKKECHQMCTSSVKDKVHKELKNNDDIINSSKNENLHGGSTHNKTIASDTEVKNQQRFSKNQYAYCKLSSRCDSIFKKHLNRKESKPIFGRTSLQRSESLSFQKVLDLDETRTEKKLANEDEVSNNGNASTEKLGLQRHYNEESPPKRSIFK